MAEFLGFDVGTTSIKVSRSIIGQSKVESISFSDGQYSFPVYYCFSTRNGSQKFGNDAKNHIGKPNLFTVVSEVKRLIGKRFDDEESQKEIKRLNIPAKKLENGMIGIVFKSKSNETVLTPLDIYEKILKEIISYLETLQIKHENAVVTVPNDFADVERNLLKELFLKNLGFQRVIIMNEPSAAGLNIISNGHKLGNYAIFDYGGGTLDLSIVKYGKDEKDNWIYEPLKHSGLRNNGGSDIDTILMDHVLEHLEQEGEEITEQLYKYYSDDKNKQKLKMMCEKCKMDLTDKKEAVIPFSGKIKNEDGEEEEMEYPFTIYRETFDSICKNIFENAVNQLLKMIDEYKQDYSEPLKGIIMVGGTSLIPKIREMIHEKTGLKPIADKDSMLAVSKGSAFRGASENLNFKTETSTYSVSMLAKHKLGFPHAKLLIKKNTQLPKTLTLEDAAISVDGQKETTIELYKRNVVNTTDNQ